MAHNNLPTYTHYLYGFGDKDVRTTKHREGTKVESRKKGRGGIREEACPKQKIKTPWRREY